MSGQDISVQIQNVLLRLEELDKIRVQSHGLVAAEVLYLSSAQL